LLGDEGPVPRQQRVRRHDRGELAQQPSPQRPSLGGEPTSLVVGEAQAPGSNLFTQDAVLFLKIVNEVALLLVEPAGERDQHELQWMRHWLHGGKPIRGGVHRSSAFSSLRPRSGFWTLHGSQGTSATFATAASRSGVRCTSRWPPEKTSTPSLINSK
jgi:hypothetical protein